MKSDMCSGCHTDNDDGTWTGAIADWNIDINNLNNATSEATLATYIADYMPQTGADSCIDQCASDIAAYMWSYRTPDVIINLVQDGDFEAAGAIAGWYSWNEVTISKSTDRAVSGTQSMYLTDRPDGGVAAYSLTSVVAAGTTYNVSAQVWLTGTDPDIVRITGSVGCVGEDTAYNWVYNNAETTPGAWTSVSGQLEVPAGCEAENIQIYFEGTGAARDLYVDDVVVTPAG